LIIPALDVFDVFDLRWAWYLVQNISGVGASWKVSTSAAATF
jgi:hypothetical protein